MHNSTKAGITDGLWITLALLIGLVFGSYGQRSFDKVEIQKAHDNESQANGLEDQCKSLLKHQAVENYVHELPNYEQ